MYKKIIKIVSFLIVITFVFIQITSVLKFKDIDGPYIVDVFYEQEDNIDVLVMGTSHVYMNVNPNVLWEDHGITSYVLAGAVQPIWNTYHNLVEALKTQKPQVVVMDVYLATSDGEYTDHTTLVKNNYGLNFSKNKVEGLKAGVPPELSFVDYLLEYPTYHTRYNAKVLQESDFAGTPSSGHMQDLYFKGYIADFRVDERVNYNWDVVERQPLPEKAHEYLMKIIELCDSENIELVLIKSPFADELEDLEYMKYNTVADIAKEHNIPFINYNIDNPANIDFSTDYFDHVHMNVSGANRLTKHLGNYLNENYEIADRRGEAGTESYDVAADMFEAMLLNDVLQKETDLSKMLTLIQDNPENYELIVSANGDYMNSVNYNVFAETLTQQGRDPNKIGLDTIYLKSPNEETKISNDPNGFNWHKNITDNIVMSISRDAAHLSPVVYLNTVSYPMTDNTVSIVVYDKLLEVFVKEIHTGNYDTSTD